MVTTRRQSRLAAQTNAGKAEQAEVQTESTERVLNKKREPLIQANRSTGLPARNEYHLSRKVFHASNALIMLYLHTHLSKFQALLALGLAASFIFCGEVLRMQWPQLNSVLAVFLRPIMRQSELRRVSGILFYLVGVFICAYAFPYHVANLSLLCLGFGDPVAAFVGVFFAKNGYGARLVLSNGKSLVGSFACFITCIGCCFAYFYFTSDTINLNSAEVLSLAVVAGASAAFAEIAITGPERPKYFDDNLSIPVIVGAALAFVSTSVLRIPLDKAATL